MAMLHTVNKSPFQSTTMMSCLNHAVEGDAVLMIEDGVLGALKGSKVAGTISGLTGQLRFYALGPDLAARGIDQSRVIEGITVVDYAGFVDLVTNHKGTNAWL